MKKEMLKKVCLLSVAAMTLGAFTGVPAQAGYTLNPEVKDATPALKQAAEIGVRKHETEALKNEKDKDAILVLSFGTTYKNSREKTINKTVEDIQAAHPHTKVVLAFTSHIMLTASGRRKALRFRRRKKRWPGLKKKAIHV
ncbi:hypothetical protein HMPREF0080_00140 [Anaeroglobus geminatus F0357]|uniref:Uncharacterized protein n=1 Tax=Anaeroglobus geminatus F0357 TaxID=861450 RepID=G9YET0_9FIRM|nr:hypothetical protein HMPREF0080_00140 [Anaeroglobus geminatus F0357]